MEDSLQESIADVCADSSDYLSIHNPENIQIGVDNVLPSDVTNPTYFGLSLTSFYFPIFPLSKFYFTFCFCKVGVIHYHNFILIFFLTSIFCHMLLLNGFSRIGFDELLSSFSCYLLVGRDDNVK